MKTTSVLYSPFDYTITFKRKHRYWVVECPELELQLSSESLRLDQLSPSHIGSAVLTLLTKLDGELHRRRLCGEPIPPPVRTTAFRRSHAVNARQAAQILGVSRATLRKMVAQGLITAHRTAGGHMRFRLETISNCMSSSNQSDSHSKPAA